MARIRMAFNVCSFLTYCDEVLVTLGHRISDINDFARVNDPPNKCPSADSCSGLGEDGKTGTTKAHPLESVEALAQEKLKAGKITAVQHDLIHLLSEMICTQDHYKTFCESLDMPPEYGPMAKPQYETWMLQTQATLIKFYVHTKSYLFRMARIRMAFNACSFLTYCDEVLVTLGHRISDINDFARVNDPPNKCPSADSCSGLGNDSSRTIRDTRESAEGSDDETGQPT